jgi:hypothetical protein
MHQRTPDPAHARSLVEAAEKEMGYVEKLNPTPDAASTIIRGIYENFRRLGAALLLLQGKQGDHEESIDELTKLTINTSRPLRALDNLRRLRHEINYKGYQPTEADLADVLSIKNACWTPVLQEVKRAVSA